MGGFTHSNALFTRDTVKNVRSQDLTSDYPSQMVMEKFPMSKPKKVQIKDEKHLFELLNNYCCVFELELFNVRPLTLFENYISESHCRELIGAIVNNGRIVSAEHLITTVTEQDFYIITRMYEWDNIKLYNFNIMRKAYLPTNFVKAILELYRRKTELKDVEGKEAEYLNAKELLNSMYGMIVTDVCRPTIKYSPFEWTEEKPDISIALNKNNKSLKRFLYYPWGVWVTAYARVTLFNAILELKDDYVYSDTDSVKYINADEHEEFFRKYNEAVVAKINRALKYHGISPELSRPKNKKGVIKQLGVWNDEGVYSRFKTLGAKRYMTEKDDKISITVSGVNKKTAVPYLLKEYGKDVFKKFDDDLFIPGEHSGKLTHTYLDDEYEGMVTDYLGNECYYHELSGIHLGDASYSLSMTDFYVKYILSVHDMEVPNDR